MCIIPSCFTDIYTVAPWYTVHFKNIHSGVTVSIQVHCEPKHLSLREIKLARYLISAYSGGTYSRSTLSYSCRPCLQEIKRRSETPNVHTAYNPHQVHLCTYVCMCDREREKVRERARGFFFPCVSTAVVWLFCDSHRQSTGNALRCGQSQLNFFSDKDRFFFFSERPDSPSLQRRDAFAEVWSVKPENVVCILCVIMARMFFFCVHFYISFSSGLI